MAGILQPASLFLPLATLIGYFFTDSFIWRSATTLLCLAIVLYFGVVKQRLAVAWWIVAAFSLSFAGDFVLGHWGGGFMGFVSGVGLFLVAHLGYVAYSLCMGRPLWWLLALLCIVFGCYYFFLLRPAISDAVTGIAVLAYILVSCLSLAAAVGIGRGRVAVNRSSRVLFIIGIGSLLFSDLLIAQKRFLHDGTLYALMMPTYFASQLFVAASIIQQRLKTNRYKSLVLFVLFLFNAPLLQAASLDSLALKDKPSPLNHLSLSALGSVGYMTPVAGLSEPLLHSHITTFYDLRLRYQTLPSDGNAFDALYRYPVIQAGLVVGDLTHIDAYYASHPQTYNSTLGCVIAPYFGIDRYFLRHGRWALGYTLLNGVSYNTSPYDAHTNAGNEYIGSHFSMYFSLGITARFRLTPQWTLSATADFKHFSAASIVRPNLGINSFGPTLGVTYDLTEQATEFATATSASSSDSSVTVKEEDGKRLSPFYVELTAAIIPKALADYYNVYHTADGPVYLSYNAMLAPMYRYLPHHASGIEVNYTYVPYTEKLHELDVIQKHDSIDGRALDYNRNVVGIGLRHDFIYRHFSVNLGVGVFVYRHQGWRGVTQEGRFYQMIGLRYSFPFTRDRLYVGYTIKAYRFSKVDGLHFGVGWRFH